MTLPEDVIAALSESGRGREPRNRADRPAAHGRRRATRARRARRNTATAAVIVIRPVAALERIPGVTLVPMPDGRALISLDDAMSVSRVRAEAARRAGRTPAASDRTDRSVMTSIPDILKTARQTRSIALHQRRIIVLAVDEAAAHRSLPGALIFCEYCAYQCNISSKIRRKDLHDCTRSQIAGHWCALSPCWWP